VERERANASRFTHADPASAIMRLFHYTIGRHLPRIVADGRLMPSDSFPGTALAALWLSTNPVWEASIVKSTFQGGVRVLLDKEQIRDLGQGLFRFEVQSGGHICTWREFIARSGIDPDLARRLEATGRDRGADPAEWYGALRPILRDEWLEIALWDASAAQWEPVQL
jgi:hypothetical protein